MVLIDRVQKAGLELSWVETICLVIMNLCLTEARLLHSLPHSRALRFCTQHTFPAAQTYLWCEEGIREDILGTFTHRCPHHGIVPNCEHLKL